MTLYDQSQTLNKLATEFISIYEMKAFVDVQLFNFYQHLRVCIYTQFFAVEWFVSTLVYAIYILSFIFCVSEEVRRGARAQSAGSLWSSNSRPSQAKGLSDSLGSNTSLSPCKLANWRPTRRAHVPGQKAKKKKSHRIVKFTSNCHVFVLPA